ncbi:MAG: hypothetical protein ACRDSZ_13775 [Pseudonocardiaceae bacterium]
MAVDLSVPLSWKAAAGDAVILLEELQSNIVKAHVRDFLSVLLLHFNDQADARGFLGALVALMKSAKTHLEEVEAFAATGAAGSPYVGVGLTPRRLRRARDRHRAHRHILQPGDDRSRLPAGAGGSAAVGLGGALSSGHP